MSTTKSAVQIQKDIFKTIQKDWDVEGEHYDPIVHLLTGACSNELEQIYLEIEEAQNRVKEELIKSLLPQSTTGPQPAYALAYIHPKAANYLLKPKNVNWQIDKKTISYTVAKSPSFSFSPLNDFLLINATISYLGVDNKLVELSKEKFIDQQKKTNVREGTKTIANQFLLVVDFHKEIENLSNVPLFFSNPNDSDVLSDAAYFKLLLDSATYVNGKQVETWQEFTPQPKDLYGQINPIRKIEQVISKNFLNNYLKFGEGAKFSLGKEIKFALEWPNSIKDSIYQHIKQTGKKSVVIEFSLDKPIDFPRNTFFSFNVFPVINRTFIQTPSIFSLRETGIHILPIPENDNFLGVEGVYEKNSIDKPFDYLPLSVLKKTDKPSYTIRTRGIGHYDTFNFWSRFGFLLKKIDAEYKNKDLRNMLGNHLSVEEFHHIIGEVAKEVSKDEPATSAYIILNSGTKKSKLEIKATYCTTNTEDANDIEANTILKGASPELIQESGILLTSTIGGKTSLNRIEQLSLFKSQLQSRSRLVTIYDIKSFCKSLLGNRLQAIDVSHGSMIGDKKHTGIIRVIDVKIKLIENQGEPSDLLLKQIQSEIEQRMSMIIPVRVAYISTAHE